MSKTAAKAMTDPFSVYATPQAVLGDDTLTTATKLRILTAMEQDLLALQNADAENMPGDEERPARLGEVRQAIHSLDPAAEAHGERERERHLAGGAPVLTKEQARQGDRLFATTRHRNMFVIYLAAAVVLLAAILFLARPWG